MSEDKIMKRRLDITDLPQDIDGYSGNLRRELTLAHNYARKFSDKYEYLLNMLEFTVEYMKDSMEIAKKEGSWVERVELKRPEDKQLIAEEVVESPKVKKMSARQRKKLGLEEENHGE